MKLIVDRITYKTVSQAELGLTNSHQTHIGLSENFIDKWKIPQKIPTSLQIFYSRNNSTKIDTILFNDPIIDPEKGARSPKFRSGYEHELPSLRDTIVYYYKLNMRGEKTPLLILFNIKNSNNLNAYLISSKHIFYDFFMNNLSEKLVIRNKNKEINSKLILPKEDDFEIIFNKLRKTKSDLIFSENDETFDKGDLNNREDKIQNKNYRKKQNEFRIKVLSAYKFKCCISGCDLPEAIEANHIDPYVNSGDKGNDIKNGIPLRADLHRLWHSGKLGIDDNYNIILDAEALNSESYRVFHGKKINVPVNDAFKPNKKHLMDHCNLKHLI